MAYSYQEFIGDGVTQTYTIPFSYVKRSEVNVFVGGTQTSAFEFLTDATINITAAPASGTVVRISRTTDLETRAVDFVAGAVLSEEDLDTAVIQVFNGAQEAVDKSNEALFKTPDGKWDAQSRVIKNLATPVNASDAVTKNWAETALSSQLAQATTQATNAASSATSAAASAASATTSASTATTKANEASSSATSAAASAVTAGGSAATAVANAATSTTQANTATTKASEASTSASNAATSATSASTNAGVATSAAATSTAQATSATASAGSATASASSAATSASNANTSANSAATSASLAQGYRDTTLGYKNSAATSATDALSSKNAAATSASNAATSATGAATSASNASASAVSAASSAASAAALLDNFDDRYLGAKAADVAVDNDGNALLVGALYFNTTDGVMKIYTANGWIAASSASIATMATFEFVATSGQTTFNGVDAEGSTLSYNAPNIIVTLNGVRLRPENDYTATDGLSIVLVSGAAAGDELVIDAFGNFAIADVVSQSAGGTFQAAVNVLGNMDATSFTVGGAPLEAGAKDGIFWENEQAVTQDYTITSGRNAGTFGAVTINSGVTVTVPTGSRWVIV